MRVAPRPAQAAPRPETQLAEGEKLYMRNLSGKRTTAALLLIALAVLLTMGGGVLARPSDPAGPSASAGTTRIQSWVLRVYFNSTAERDRLATELGAEE